MIRNTGVAILILVVVSLAVFGAFAMHGTRGCLAAAAYGGAACPPGGPLILAGFFLEALRGFSTASLGILGAIALLAFLSLSWFSNVGFLFFSQITRRLFSRFSVVFSPSLASLVSWLTLHERRDPAIAA